MSEGSRCSHVRVRSIIAILLAAIFITSAASALISRPASAGTDLNPYIDLAITVKILRFRAIDNMNPDFSCAVVVGADAQGSPHVYQSDYSPTGWSWTFSVDDTISEPVVEIHLFGWTDSTHYVECDISAGSSQFWAVLHHDLTTARWHGAPEYGTVDYLGDSNGYGHVSGDEDGASTHNVDCELWFWITQNDNDCDGLTYQQEVNGFTIQDDLLDGVYTKTYHTDPLVTNYEDFDGDDLGCNAENNAGTSPILKDSDGDKIWDGFEVRHPDTSTYKLDPRISTDAKPFMEKMLSEYEKIPNLLTGMSAWMVFAELQVWLNAYAHSVLGQICSPPGNYALAQGMLLGFGDLAFSVSWAPSFAFAYLTYWQATHLSNAATTFDQGLWMFSSVDGHTYGYIEQSRIGAKDLASNPASTIADPKFDVATQTFKYQEGSIAWYYNEMAKVLRFLLGQSGSGASNWDNRPAIEFEDILYIHKTLINPLFDPQLNSGGKSFPNPSSYNFFYTKKDANGHPTQESITITETGYSLEHQCMEFVKAVDQGFDFVHYSGIPYDARLAFIGTGPDGSPLNAVSPVRVWVACADLCSIGYGTYETIRMLRESSSTLLSYQNDWAAPVITSVSINQGATYTTGSAVTVDVVVTETGTGTTEIRYHNEGNGWSAWDSYSPSKSWTLTTGEGQKTVTVQVRDRLGFLSNERSDTIFVDTANPVISNFVINNGDVYTSSQTVTLTISASDTGTGLNGMRLNNEGGTWTGWESYATSKQWGLSTGQGLKTVNIEIRDSAGRVSTRSDQITLDTQDPTVSLQINNGALYTNTVNVNLQITASDSGGSGLAGMCFWDWHTNAWTAWEPCATTKAWTLWSGDGTKYAQVKVKDMVGRESIEAYNIITLDTHPPTVDLKINNDEAYTGTTSVTVTIVATDSTSGVNQMHFAGCQEVAPGNTWTTWEPCQSTKSLTLLSGEGTKTITVEVSDSAGNLASDSDTIILDAPPVVDLLINGGVQYTSSTSVALTITASDPGGSVAQMRFSSDGDAWTAWETYANTKSWTFTTGDGLKVVFVEVNDNLGQVSLDKATIILNTGAPTPPLNLVATAGTSTVTLTWDPPASSGGSYVQHYHVFKGVTSGGELEWVMTRTDTYQYTDSQVAGGSLYFYRVTCENSEGESLFSNEVSVFARADVSVFSDNFNDGDLAGWTFSYDPYGNGRVIEVTQPAGFTSPAMHISYTSSRWARATTPQLSADFTVPYRITFKMYIPLPQAVEDRRIIVVDDGRVYLWECRGVYYANANTLVGVGTVTYNSWEDIEIRSDPVASTYVFVLNGVSSAPIPFWTYEPRAQAVSFGSDASAGKRSFGEAYWDDVAVYSVTPLSAPWYLNLDCWDSQVTARWIWPTADGGREITHYNLYRGTCPGGETLLATVDGAQVDDSGFYLYFDDTSVTNGLTYYYRVSAVTSAGEGPLSEELSIIPCGPPSPPQNLAASPGNAAVTLTWSPPADDGGTPISIYYLYRGGAPGGELYLGSTTGTTYTDSGLTPGATYYYVVTSYNLLYQSALSNEVAAKPFALPSAPQLLTATPANHQVTLSWSLPASDGGSPVTIYKVYRGASSGVETYLADAPTTSYIDNDVVNGQTYYYSVSALNAGGEGPKSNEATAMPAGPPGPPRNLVAAAGNAKVTLTWSAPLEFFGSAVTRYNIYRGTSPNGEVYLNWVSATTLTYVDTSVTNGVTYYYKVTAVNSPGEGPASNEASAIPIAPTAPGPPQNLVAVAGTMKVTLTWAAPLSSGSSQIQIYKIYRGTTSNGETYLNQVGGTVLSFVDQSVTAGTKYYYKVTAINLEAEGTYSNEASGTPTSLSKPTAPLNLVATGASKSIKLTWSAPSSDGGSLITSWKIYRGTKAGSEKLLTTYTGTALTWTDTGLRAGTKYFYKISAVNAVGEGPQSNEASATVLATMPLGSIPIDGNLGGGLAYALTLLWVLAAVIVAALWSPLQRYRKGSRRQWCGRMSFRFVSPAANS